MGGYNCGYNCMCLWKRCANKEQRSINFNYFWSKVSYDVCGSRVPHKDFSQQICQMYFPKSLILTTNESNYIVTIGIVPTEKFQVKIRLESEDSGFYIEMTVSEARQLFILLHQTFYANLIHPSVHAAAATQSINSKENVKINLKLFHHNTYELHVGDKKIFISTDGLLTLMENEYYIKVLIKKYEAKATLCGNTVFKLLNLCCQQLQNPITSGKYFACDDDDNSAIVLTRNNQELLKKINLSDILDELLCSPCNCLSTTFIIETKMHFQNLISFWIGAFYETRLLSEAARLKTFEKKKKWPHKYIETRTLAKNGFFYVGPFDQVQCVFCKTLLKKWEPKDTVEGEHKRFAPFCHSSLDRAANNIPVEVNRE